VDEFIDQPRALRSSDSFNQKAIDEWLKEKVDGLEGSPEVFQFRGGASNLTYLIKYSNREFVMRRPPPGHKAKSAHDMGREFRVMSALRPYYPYVPQMIAFCNDSQVLGSEFYVMERLKGIILRRNLPQGMASGKMLAGELCRSVFDKLVELHQVDVEKAGLSDLGRGKGYVKRQVEGWSDRYTKSKTWNVPNFRYVMDWLKNNQPDDVKICLIHNDFRFDNVVLNPENHGEIVGVLDWEMATLGDPLMDLGGALAYWVESSDDFLMRYLRRQPSHLEGMMKRIEIVEYYGEKTGLKIENWNFYQVFGLFRLGVIIQQIYYRYHHDQTDNPAFRSFWFFVNYLHWRCRKIIKKGAL